jgi:hypothetical protein
MSDPLIDRVKRFTPEGRGLDRDALFYAAGRASVPSPRGWMALAGVLALSQVLTLLVVLARPAAPGPVSPAPAPAPARPVETPAPEASPSELLALRRHALREGELPRPAPSGSLVPPPAPLPALSVFHPLIEEAR